LAPLVKEALAYGRQTLRRAGVPEAAVDAEVLLAHVLATDRLALYRDERRALSPREWSLFRDLLARRARREPVAYLTGRKEFMGLTFAVNRAVLIPRPETELLVERALALLADREAPVVVDVGTGCGAVAVSLAYYHCGAEIYATDISEAALAVARENAARHGVAHRVSFYCGDLLAPVAFLAGRVDLVAANLPYVPSAELARLPPDVRNYEPRAALDGGPDGLALHRRLVPQATRTLRTGGVLLAEVGPGQGGVLAEWLAAAGWRGTRLILDYGGRERVVEAVR
jgi:release factor glutamine methyltransferase